MNSRFKIYTLVDITCTNARKGEDYVAYQQQQNYLTVLQTIGLRVNPTVDRLPYIVNEPIKFGRKHQNCDRIWCFEFEIEFEDAIDVEIMKNDFDLIPFIDQLTETATFDDAVFRTKCENDTNIIFCQQDK